MSSITTVTFPLDWWTLLLSISATSLFLGFLNDNVHILCLTTRIKPLNLLKWTVKGFPNHFQWCPLSRPQIIVFFANFCFTYVTKVMVAWSLSFYCFVCLFRIIKRLRSSKIVNINNYQHKKCILSFGHTIECPLLYWCNMWLL